MADEQITFEDTRYFSAAHKNLEKYLEICDGLAFTVVNAEEIRRLQSMPGAYHERYGKRLSAQEETWLKEYDAIHPLELV